MSMVVSIDISDILNNVRGKQSSISAGRGNDNEFRQPSRQDTYRESQTENAGIHPPPLLRYDLPKPWNDCPVLYRCDS